MLDLGLGVRAERDGLFFVIIDEGENFSLEVSDGEQKTSYSISKKKGRQPVHDSEKQVVTSVFVRDQWHVKEVDPQPFIERFVACAAS